MFRILRYTPRSRIDGPYGGSSSRSVRNLHAVFQGGVPGRIPTSGLGGSLFFASSATLVVFDPLHDGHSDRWEVISRGIDLHFSDD